MTRLMEEDVAADDDFWGQDALKEVSPITAFNAGCSS